MFSDNSIHEEEVMHTSIVKNTFIEIVNPRCCDSRRTSIPASLRLFLEHPLRFENLTQSDASTSGDVSSAATYSPPWSPLCSPKSSSNSTRNTSETSNQESAKSRSLYKAKSERVLKRYVKNLQTSNFISGVEVTYGFQDCSIHIHPNGDEDMFATVTAFAKKTLLEVSSDAHIYVMGYCSPNAFVDNSTGFEATLGAMGNAGKACWHIFKKGFCRHDNGCAKQHPVYRMPVSVIVETSKETVAKVSSSIRDFQIMLIGLVHTYSSMLEQSPHIKSVRPMEDTSSPSWTIELIPHSYVAQHEDSLITVAKHQLLQLIKGSAAFQIIDNDGCSFLRKPDGFTVLLGDASCSLDGVSKGVPINVVFKLN